MAAHSGISTSCISRRARARSIAGSRAYLRSQASPANNATKNSRVPPTMIAMGNPRQFRTVARIGPLNDRHCGGFRRCGTPPGKRPEKCTRRCRPTSKTALHHRANAGADHGRALQLLLIFAHIAHRGNASSTSTNFTFPTSQANIKIAKGYQHELYRKDHHGQNARG